MCFGGPFWSTVGCPIGRGEQAGRVCRWDLVEGSTQGKCSFTRYKDILAGTAVKGRARERRGKEIWLYSAWWKIEITRQEIDEIVDSRREQGTTRTRVSTVHATSKKEPALLQHGTTPTATGRSLGVVLHFPVEKRHASDNGAESINRHEMLVCLDAHKTAMHLIKSHAYR